MLTPEKFHENKIDQQIKDCRHKISAAMNNGETTISFRGRLCEPVIHVMLQELTEAGWHAKVVHCHDIIHGPIDDIIWQDAPFEEKQSLNDKIRGFYCNDKVKPEFKYYNAYSNGFLLILVCSVICLWLVLK